MNVNWISVKDKLPEEDDFVWSVDHYTNKKGEPRKSMSMSVYEELGCIDCNEDHGEYGFRLLVASVGDCNAILRNVSHWAQIEYPDYPLIDNL